jgi:hypothetical protein
MQTIKTFILGLGVASSLVACMPQGFLVSKPTASTAQQSVAIEPKTQSNDRPTETGAGVPGYLVNCSDINAAGELVQVGCSVASRDGKRVPTTEDSWTRYEVKPAPNANPNIRISKSMAASGEPWDVIFGFTGAPVAELRMAAQSSTYTYSEADEKGETVTAETPPPVAPKPAPAPTNQACTDGVLLEGICMVSVSSSCTDYCAQSQLKVHPWVVERFGAGAAGNRQACADLYEKFPDNTPIPMSFGVNDVMTFRGLGCHRSANGQTFFDSATTDPSTAPFFGYSRICACQ